jgi:hypothetical protein
MTLTEKILEILEPYPSGLTIPQLESLWGCGFISNRMMVSLEQHGVAFRLRMDFPRTAVWLHKRYAIKKKEPDRITGYQLKLL